MWKVQPQSLKTHISFSHKSFHSTGNQFLSSILLSLDFEVHIHPADPTHTLTITSDKKLPLLLLLRVYPLLCMGLTDTPHWNIKAQFLKIFLWTNFCFLIICNHNFLHSEDCWILLPGLVGITVVLLGETPCSVLLYCASTVAFLEPL